VRARVAELVDSGRARFVDMVRVELWNGLKQESPRRFLAELEEVVECLPTTSEVWARTRRLAVRARAAGLTIPAPDLLIQACAAHHGAEVYSRDAHFDALAKLAAKS
jgi:predicted nucleic acid-binding protein